MMRRLTTALLACWLLAGQEPWRKFNSDLPAPNLRVAVVEEGRVVWQRGKINARACEEPVIAERLPKEMLFSPAPAPPNATIREVLENRADGTPGEEVLENREFVQALHADGNLPNAVDFAKSEHGAIGWFRQDYADQRILWCRSEAVLILRVPDRKITLVASDSSQLDDGNIARSWVALAFFKDVVGMAVPESDLLIAQGMVRQALDKYPELESLPDVSLLHLFAKLGLPETEASATAVIKNHPSLPTAWFYYGQYLENNKRYREAAACFEKITTHQPPWHNWTVSAAKRELTHLKTY